LNSRWAGSGHDRQLEPDGDQDTEDSVDNHHGRHKPHLQMHMTGASYRPRFDYHRRAVESENEAFFLRISKSRAITLEGADLGIFWSPRRRFTDEQFVLTTAQEWITGSSTPFAAKPLPAADVGPVFWSQPSDL